MKIKTRNYLWITIFCFILAGFVETGYVTAQDKPPSPPPINKQIIKSTGGSGIDKPPTPPPQGVETDQSLPSGSGDMFPPTNPLVTEQNAEVGESTADSVNIPSSHGRTKGEIQKDSPANAPKPTYEIKPKKSGSTPDKAIPQRSISR